MLSIRRLVWSPSRSGLHGRVSQSQVGPAFDSYSCWAPGDLHSAAAGRLTPSWSDRGTATRFFDSPLLQPLPLLRCFCYIRPCRLDVPGLLSSPSSSPSCSLPAIHNITPSHVFDCQRGVVVSDSEDLLSYRGQGQAKSWERDLASSVLEKVILHDEYHLITAGHG